MLIQQRLDGILFKVEAQGYFCKALLEEGVPVFTGYPT